MPSPVPIGTVLLFAGDCRNSSVILKLGLAGWMPCNGDSLLVSDYPDLYNVIGVAHGGEIHDGCVIRFNLPRMNGAFARGVNMDRRDPAGKYVDPEADARLAVAPNGNLGNKVGSSQPQATALPRTPFATDSPGEHTHVGHHLSSDDHYAYSGSTWQVCRQTSGCVTTPDDGAHYHTIIGGGDDRTVPVNMATFFIIKFQ